MNPMNIIEEEFLTDETDPADEDVLKEAWPVTQEELTREFEQYLLDIGVRI